MRHDAVAWGYARGADSRGVDIIQNCEVTGFRIENGSAGCRNLTRLYRCKQSGRAVAVSSGRLMAKAGMRLPIESHVLAGLRVSRAQTVLPGVITFGAGHFYCSQSDKGGLVLVAISTATILMPSAAICPWSKTSAKAAWRSCRPSGARVCCGCGAASWICRWTARPIIDQTHIEGLYFNGGWCYGGFKATPASGLCLCPSSGQRHPA